MAVGRKTGGRQKGSKNKVTLAREKIAASGEAPLDVMLRAMKVHVDAGEWDEAAEIAARAAPYCHPRLASVDVGNRDGVPFVINIKRFGDAEGEK